MRLGIDFGTTRTVVATCDRGNYPVFGFVDQNGDPQDFFPSVVAARGDELKYGFDALAVAADPAWTVRRSFKRMMGRAFSTADREVKIGDARVPLFELVAGFLSALREALVRGLGRRGKGALECVVATPANALGAQRFATLDAFRRAGFEVAAMLNRPSAYENFQVTHRYRSTLTSKREHVVVYDLGGGTFDASLLRMTGLRHDVVATSGMTQLGGDDFDAVLVRLALEAAGLDLDALTPRAHAALVNHCREVKEGLNPNSRRIVIDLEGCLEGSAAPRP